MDKYHEKLITESINRLINQSIDQTIDQSIDQSINQSVNQLKKATIQTNLFIEIIYNLFIIKVNTQWMNESNNQSIN